MIKKIITFFILYFIILLWNVFSASIPVEQIFSDIKKDYKYYNELQVLFDKWMIYPDSEGRLNPKKLLNRDEFVWIMMEVSCNKCISPNVNYDFIKKYSDSTLFFDINKTNKYFYCVAWADSSWFVKWYDSWTKCEDWSYKPWEKPFCPNNTIILEEALAVILRASGILTNSEADSIRMQIASGQITKNLSDDVTPKNLDGSVYSFYPDFQKALDYELVEYDKYWNQKIYKLIEIIDWKIRPKQSITKEDFLRIAYIALKSNSCNEKKEDKLWLEIQIFDNKCVESSLNKCTRASLSGSEKVFDIFWNVSLPFWDTISKENSYIWRFYNYNTWEEIKKYWKYLDNYDFLKDWDYRVFLRVISDKGNTWEVYNDINISSNKNENNNKLSIIANPIFWKSPLLVKFESVFSFDSVNNSYLWDFWDGTTSIWKNTDHIFKEPWIYKVTLNLKDKDWEIYTSTVNINVTWESSEVWDYDKDWINDLLDVCPQVKWLLENKWCPVFDDFCKSDTDCKSWYYCKTWICSPKQTSINCEYNWWDLITWNVICNSCPCNNFVDFNATLRKCDKVFPAIVSPDKKTIYSKWSYYEIK